MFATPDLRGVPPVYRAAAVDSVAARAALALLRAGHPPPSLTRRHLRAGGEQLAARELLAAWLERQHRRLAHFRLELTLMTGDDEPGSAQPGTLFVWNSGCEVFHSRWVMKQKFEALERAHPGLAETALCWIGRTAGVHTLPIYTPAEALADACHAWWYGETDESTIVAEHDAQNDTDPITAADLDIITREELDADLPPCVQSARARLSFKALEAIERGPKRAASKLAHHLRALITLVRQRSRQREDLTLHRLDEDGREGNALGHVAFLRWAPVDLMGQIFDDAAEMAFNAEGGSEALGWYRISPEALPAALRDLEQRIEALGHIEQMLPAIAHCIDDDNGGGT